MPGRVQEAVTAVPANLKKASPHPLDPLSSVEIDIAREAVLRISQNSPVVFRAIFTEEPRKAELIKFLQAEHRGAPVVPPPRQARVQYDVINANRSRDYIESIIDLATGTEALHRVVDKQHQPALTIDEFRAFQDACMASPLWKEAIANFHLPEGFEVVIDPWPYGGPDSDEVYSRYTQGLCFAKDGRIKNRDTNHYGYPLPIIPVMDTYKSEIVRIDKLATGGRDDDLNNATHGRNVLDHCSPAEYVPELLDTEMRKDLKPLNVVQPEGASFTVTDGTLVQWQKWRFRVGFTPRECAVLYDIHYDGRSVMYRLSLSEMTVPYGDPRRPFHRKQAFDFGDAGAGRAANNLAVGCDCLGAIQYLDAVLCGSDGKPYVSENVVCIHEQDSGIGWKHTNYRTGRAVVTRYRELVIQFIITLANYEYVFAYKFDQAGGIAVETRATGIVSVVNIDKGKTSAYGNVVSPGALAQNHQHLFAIRIDPAIDGYDNTVFYEETLPIPMNPKTNPFGNGYQVVSRPVTNSAAIDASPFTNLTIKMSNTKKMNPISSKPVSYKFVPSPTQMLLADPNSTMAKRAGFAQHHVWVTQYRDHELYAGGEFTNQSRQEIDGVVDAVARNDDIEDSDVVVWSVFGLTHNPRVEDWPVMPIEKHEMHFKPADFFDRNPALDVPGNKNLSSVEVNGKCCGADQAVNGYAKTPADPLAHLQGEVSVSVNGLTEKLMAKR